MCVCVEEVQTRQEKKWKGQEDVAIPRTLMIAKCGGLNSFHEAIERNEITEVEDTDTDATFYAWRSYKVGSTEEATRGFSSKTQRLVDKNEVAKMNQLLTSVDWNFVSPKANNKLKALSGDAGTKVSEAIVALEKKLKDGRATANKLANEKTSGTTKLLSDLKGSHCCIRKITTDDADFTLTPFPQSHVNVATNV